LAPPLRHRQVKAHPSSNHPGGAPSERGRAASRGGPHRLGNGEASPDAPEAEKWPTLVQVCGGSQAACRSGCRRVACRGGNGGAQVALASLRSMNASLPPVYFHDESQFASESTDSLIAVSPPVRPKRGRRSAAALYDSSPTGRKVLSFTKG